AWLSEAARSTDRHFESRRGPVTSPLLRVADGQDRLRTSRGGARGPPKSPAANQPVASQPASTSASAWTSTVAIVSGVDRSGASTRYTRPSIGAAFAGRFAFRSAHA